MRRFCWLMVLATACDDFIYGEAGGTCDQAPSQDGIAGVEELVKNQCFSCHGASVAAQAGNGFDMETDFYGATVNVSSSYGVPLVTPGDSANSLLYEKITGTQPDGTGGQMPPGTPLCSEATDVVQQWIDDGANPS